MALKLGKRCYEMRENESTSKKMSKICCDAMCNPLIACLEEAGVLRSLIDICSEYCTWEVCIRCQRMTFKALGCLPCHSRRSERLYWKTNAGFQLSTIPNSSKVIDPADIDDFDKIMFHHCNDQEIWNHIESSIGKEFVVLFDVSYSKEHKSHHRYLIGIEILTSSEVDSNCKTYVWKLTVTLTSKDAIDLYLSMFPEKAC